MARQTVDFRKTIDFPSLKHAQSFFQLCALDQADLVDCAVSVVSIAKGTEAHVHEKIRALGGTIRERFEEILP